MGVVARRFEIYLVNLDPAIGSEIRKTRPCVIISPIEMNSHLQTVIVAPMTTRGQPYPTSVPCEFQGKRGLIVLDQIRAVHQVRLVKCLGKLTATVSGKVLDLLAEMFSP